MNINGYTIEEMANILNITPVATRQRIHVLNKELKQKIIPKTTIIKRVEYPVKTLELIRKNKDPTLDNPPAL